MKTGIELEEAVGLMEAAVSPLGAESLPLTAALGRTLAADLTTPLDNPPFDRSPLDGYALRAADIAGASQESPVRLTVVDTVYAGDVAAVPVEQGQCVRIMTGAMLPQGCDCVLMQEKTDMGSPVVEVYQPLKAWDNYCYRGEDYKAGSVLLPAGTRLDAAAVGVLASAGLCESIQVRRRPSAAVLSTGDEVVAPEIHPLPAGKIYGSNAHLIWARLKELGISEVHYEQIGDDPAAVADAMARLCGQYDVLITTGGVSVGDKDIFHEALPLLGAERLFWKVKLKPGTPAMFSLWQGKPILSLSGNPFAAASTFELLGRPLLAALAGESGLRMARREAVLATPFGKKSPGRRFLRGTYADGRVTLPSEHSSGLLSSLVGCNCLVDIPAGSGALEAGQTVGVHLMQDTEASGHGS